MFLMPFFPFFSCFSCDVKIHAVSCHAVHASCRLMSCRFSCHVMPIFFSHVSHVMPVHAYFFFMFLMSCQFMPFFMSCHATFMPAHVIPIHANLSIFMPIHAMFHDVMPVHASCQLMSCGFMSHVNSCLMPAHVMPIHATFISHVSHAAPPHPSCHLMPNSFFHASSCEKSENSCFSCQKSKTHARFHAAIYNFSCLSCLSFHIFMSFMSNDESFMPYSCHLHFLFRTLDGLRFRGSGMNNR